MPHRLIGANAGRVETVAAAYGQCCRPADSRDDTSHAHLGPYKMVHLLSRPPERARRQATAAAGGAGPRLQSPAEVSSVECKQERSGQNYRRPIFTDQAPLQTATADDEDSSSSSNSISPAANVVTYGGGGAGNDEDAAAHAPAWSSGQCHRPGHARASLVAILLGAVLACAPAGASAGRMVRLCIASVEPAKLSSQCVMCNRREFPLTVIDCTGITKVNDLVANPLSVQEAACLIYNCRRQVPNIMPEPYHGAISHAARVNGHHYGPPPTSGGMHNYQETGAPQLSSPTSTSMAMLPVSLANLFGGLPPAGATAALGGPFGAPQPSYYGGGSGGGGFYPPNQQQQQQQALYQAASSAPYLARYAALGPGPYAAVPVQFVQQSAGPLGALRPAPVLGNFLRASPMSIAAAPWPQSGGTGSNGFVYDAASAAPLASALVPIGPAAMSPQAPYSAMMVSAAK